MATLMVQFKQSCSRGPSPKNTPTKDTPTKDKGRGRLTPTKKMLTPDNTVEPPVKKQHTGSPSSEWESETKNGKAEKKKKKKKKKVKSDPIVVTNSKVEETEVQQESRQWVRKWKQELMVQKDYWESHNIFLTALPEWNRGSHTGYLESVLDANPGHFFIRSINDWRLELQKQSQGIRHSVATTCRRLNTLQ